MSQKFMMIVFLNTIQKLIRQLKMIFYIKIKVC